MIVGNAIPFEARSKLKIRLVSAYVLAGIPSPADDHLERLVDLNEHLVANPAANFEVKHDSEAQQFEPYCLRAIAQSLIKAGKKDGWGAFGKV
jgi:hypothetical protein